MLNEIVVLGGGTMACGIAAEAALHGYPVTLWYYKPPEAVQKRLNLLLDKIMDSRQLNGADREAIRTRITLTSDLEACCHSDLIIESIAENQAAKISLFHQLTPYIDEHTLLCTNTSSLSINTLAAETPCKSRFAGLHFFNPVGKMRLVEIVAGDATSDAAIASLKDFALHLEKEAILVRDAPGFIVNRILMAYVNHAARLLQSGIASAADIDQAMKLGANHPVGPFALCDLIGIDIVHDILQSLHSQLGDELYNPCPVFAALVSQGKLGRKTGAGFYTYSRSL